MRIEGVYLLSASHELVWSLLQDPVTIKQALPGCDEFDQIAPYEYTAALYLQRGPFKGNYRGQIESVPDELSHRFDLTLQGEGPDGAVLGTGKLFLTEQDRSTKVQYEGDVVFTGIAAEKSPRMLRTTTNALIRQFFESLDRQIRIQTGTHTTTLDEQLPRERRTGTIDMQDAIAGSMKDKQTARLVFSLIALVILTIFGAFTTLFLLVRWAKRTFDRRIVTIFHEKQQDKEPRELA